MNDLHSKPLPSLEQSNLLLGTYARDAMKFLMLRQQSQYLSSMQKLAEICANLIKNHKQPVENIINQIEAIMTDAYEPNRQSVLERIAQYQDMRKTINLNMLFGERDDHRLLTRIDALNGYKDTELKDIIFNVITDALNHAEQAYETVIEHTNFQIFNDSPSISKG
ncbi:hypothetical protein [Legionella jamestowniensis]|uniref:Uncharacterized protein n=1 Tax=Legionella jamestowniensis TaxID=455 RepID=A0A0W0UJT4_9GAMM|nr:hypothetical protein [Legionella jamestowniensis]KTD07785.1 hypothetical protein Ljam_1980 [Legionella jamestowniensis]OCH99516.1 hypothetical protein A8135_07510 [Legionella jamestowniensis]SFL62150.1 hypothetical protein SAMN02746073_1104 [Legionella jamestowniensis DSM 19215]